MKLEQTQSLAQKLVLTQNMRQSLDCLQLSAPELSEYVQEIALSNPLLDVQDRPLRARSRRSARKRRLAGRIRRTRRRHAV